MSQTELFEQLRHPNPHLRDRAVVEILENRDDNTLPTLMSALDDEDVVYRRTAVKALGLLGFDAVPPLVEVLLQSENVTVRGSAAKALAQVAICYPEDPFPELGLQGLGRSLHDENPVVNIAAAMALGQIGSQAFDILTSSLKTTDNLALQVSIVNALAAVGDDNAMAVLAELAQDDAIEGYVKETAVSALSRLELVRNNRPRG
jgi:bilin biosynthesis protein